MASRSTIALFTTTPARLITPMPLMIIPKGMSNTRRPVNTPMSDNTTEAIMIIGTKTELNCMTSTMLMMKMAV